MRVWQHWLRLLTLLSLVVIAGCGLLQERGITFGYNFKPGDVVRYKLTVTSNITTDLAQAARFGGLSLPLNRKASLECLFTQKVISVDQSGMAEIELSYESINEKPVEAEGAAPPIAPQIGQSGSSTQMPQGMQTDTLTLPSQRLPSLFNYLQGRTIGLKMGRDGYLMELSGIDEVVDQLVSPTSEGEDVSQVKQGYREAMRNLIEQSIYIVPRDEFKPGDLWIREDVVRLPYLGQARLKMINTVNEVVPAKGYECRRVKIESSVLSLDQDKGLLKVIKDKQLISNFEGKGNGEVLFACQQGLLIKSDLTNKVSVHLKDATSQQAVGRIDVETKINLELQ